jgi:hypothetical protein
LTLHGESGMSDRVDGWVHAMQPALAHACGYLVLRKSTLAKLVERQHTPLLGSPGRNANVRFRRSRIDLLGYRPTKSIFGKRHGGSVRLVQSSNKTAVWQMCAGSGQTTSPGRMRLGRLDARG